MVAALSTGLFRCPLLAMEEWQSFVLAGALKLQRHVVTWTLDEPVALCSRGRSGLGTWERTWWEGWSLHGRRWSCVS
jgi:hypothetical protein